MSDDDDIVLPDLLLPQGAKRLPDLTGDLRQLASVRGIVLDDGAERGTRALAFSTGGGLDFWVLSDRTMDIGPLWFRGLPVAWQHPAGFVAPALHDPGSDGGTGIERNLSGFLVTCGLDNVRQPRNGLPLHGTMPLTPARVTSSGEDWDAPVPCLYAEGEAIRAHLSGPSFRLTRRIEAPVGGRDLKIIDRVENIGPAPSDMRILYHFNFGFPAVGEDTRLDIDGEPQVKAGAGQAPTISCHRSTADERFCARLIRPRAGIWPGISVSIEGPVESLPFMQVWSDPRPRRNVLAIEPSNCDRLEDGTSAEGFRLGPGEIWSTELRVSLADPVLS